MTIDLNNHGGFVLNNNYLDPPITNLRLDHLRLTGNGGGDTGRMIQNWGCRGVIDNCIMDDTTDAPLRLAWGNDAEGLWDWEHFGQLQYGVQADALYVEDCVITFNATEEMTDGERGGQVVFRYNTISAPNSWPCIDLHSAASPDMYAPRGGEYYGNIITAQDEVWHHRGGRALIFYNYATNSSGVINQYINTGCPPTPYVSYQNLNTSYYWRNRRGSVTGSLVPRTFDGSNCGSFTPTANVDWWIDASPFTGATGIGAGTLAARPSSGLTAGVGYWATDQSITSLSGLVGASTDVSGGTRSPSSYLQGTLYRATGATTWETLFTPLTYPHPLRDELSPPSGTIVLSVR